MPAHPLKLTLDESEERVIIDVPGGGSASLSYGECLALAAELKGASERLRTRVTIRRLRGLRRGPGADDTGETLT